MGGVFLCLQVCLGQHRNRVKTGVEMEHIPTGCVSRATNHREVKRNQKDYEGAIADYTQAILLNPEYASAYNNRGFAKYNQKDFEGAMVDYTQAILLNPKYAVAHNNRGETKSILGD